MDPTKCLKKSQDYIFNTKRKDKYSGKLWPLLKETSYVGYTHYRHIWKSSDKNSKNCIKEAVTKKKNQRRKLISMKFGNSIRQGISVILVLEMVRLL